ncbi:hypothetical protein J7643_06360 [bacterium]|nr:hypothetical protein [bacterium]
MQQRILPILMASTFLLSGCGILSSLGATVGFLEESSEAKAARENAERLALGSTGISTSPEPKGPVEMVLATKTELAPYEEFSKRGLIPANAEYAKTPTYLVHTKPRDFSSGEYRLVKSFVQNGSLIGQVSSPRISLFDPFNVEVRDRVEFLVSEPCPNLGTQVTFTLKGLTLTKPIKFYLGSASSDGAMSENWLSIGESTPVDGVVNISVQLKEDMGTYTDGSPARFQRGRYYGLGYVAEGMNNPTLIRPCPAGVYLPM